MKNITGLTYILTLSLVAFAAFVLGSCRSTQFSPYMKNNKAFIVDRPMFDVKGVRLGDSTVQISFVTSSSLRTSDRSIRFVEAFIGPDAKHLDDSLQMSTSMAGTPGVDPTVLFIGEAHWDTPAAKRSSRAVADISIVNGTDHIIFRTDIEYRKVEPLDMVAFIRPMADSTIEVGAIAKRVFVPQGEYLPTSESFRVLISDGKGSVVWRSDAGMAFLSVVASVEPQAANAIHRYVMPWNGRDLAGLEIPPGEYHADILVPARPNPYTTSINFTWPLR